jgi:hypothetical protein
MSSNVFSGARAIFRISGAPVAFASGVDGSEEVMYEAVDVLNRLEVAEYVPVGYRVTLNCNIFRTTVKTPTGAVPISPEAGKTGSLKHANIFPKFDSILTKGQMSAEIEDSQTGAILYHLTGVKAQSLNFSITSRGIVGQNVSFNALKMTSEGE